MHLSPETPTPPPPPPRGDVGHWTAERKKGRKSPTLKGRIFSLSPD